MRCPNCLAFWLFFVYNLGGYFGFSKIPVEREKAKANHAITMGEERERERGVLELLLLLLLCCFSLSHISLSFLLSFSLSFLSFFSSFFFFLFWVLFVFRLSFFFSLPNSSHRILCSCILLCYLAFALLCFPTLHLFIL